MRDERRAVALQHAALQPGSPGVAAGEDAVARRRADGRDRVRIGEADALLGECVDVRRWDLAALRVVGVHVAVAEIVAEDVDDVGPQGRSRWRRRGGGGGGAAAANA